MQSRLEREAEQREKVGQGITYRFNNFKSKAVLKQAKETQDVERMLYHVKRLIRKREQLYKDAHRRKDSVKQRRADRRLSVDSHMHRITEREESDGSASDGEQTYQQRLDARMQSEKQLLKREYEKRIAELSCCNKLYLWLRRNWVVDILFRQSPEQLDHIVRQMESGRTSVKTQVELGMDSKAKKERQFEVEQQLSDLLIHHKRAVNETEFIKIDRAPTLLRQSQKEIKAEQRKEEQESQEAAPDKDVILEENASAQESAPDKGVHKYEIVESSILQSTQSQEKAAPRIESLRFQSTDVRDSGQFNNKLKSIMNNIDHEDK